MFRNEHFRVFILFPMCVLCVCACWQTRAVCVHGVGAQRLCVQHGSVCVCVCARMCVRLLADMCCLCARCRCTALTCVAWECVCVVMGHGEVGRRSQVGAPHRRSALMATVPQLCPHSPLGCSTVPCGHQPRHEVT